MQIMQIEFSNLIAGDCFSSLFAFMVTTMDYRMGTLLSTKLLNKVTLTSLMSFSNTELSPMQSPL